MLWVVIVLIVIIIILICIIVMRPPPPQPSPADCSEWKDWAKHVRDKVKATSLYIAGCNCPGPDPGEPDPPPGGWDGLNGEGGEGE